MLIDAHIHLWRVGKNGFEWPTPDLAPIHRDFAPADIRAAAGQALSGVVAVQSQPSEADTAWLLWLAERQPLIHGVVGWTDLAAPDAGLRIAEAAANPRLRGLRPMLQNLEDDGWILRPEVAPALAAMQTHGLVFDALVHTRHLAAICRVAELYPDLRIVIDHAAKPPIATQRERPEETLKWFEAITAAAQYPSIVCKLSGLFTEMSPDQPPEAADPFIAHLLEVFGPDRLLFGSDWPVVNLRGDWSGWHSYLTRKLSALTPTQRDAIFAFNAIKTYGLQGNP
ncbi:MAG: amidohydrolase family protein [Asticcacaulis sp.]